MKKLLIPLFAIFALTLSANAQQKREMKGHQHKKHQHGMMANQLSFSEEQKKQSKSINEDFRKKMQELNKNESITVKESRDRKAALLKEKKAKMEGMLNAEQRTKMTQLKADHKVKAEERYVKHLNRMKTNLSLTDEQVAKLKTQRTGMQAKMEKIKSNESLSRIEKHEQMMALKSDAKEQHKKIFTAEQMKKMEEMKKNRGNRSRTK